MNEQEVNNVINQIKAESFDQISGLNRQLTHLSGQLNNTNNVIKAVADIVAPGEELTVDALIAKLKDAFNPQTDGKELKDGIGTGKESNP